MSQILEFLVFLSKKLCLPLNQKDKKLIVLILRQFIRNNWVLIALIKLIHYDSNICEFIHKKLQFSSKASMLEKQKVQIK